MIKTSSLNNRLELGVFLTARRQQLSPASAGLSPGGRRRTPGLRREEVALLAHVSPTWYTRLEQGQPIGVSARVIHGIARALQLTELEERHVLALAGLPTAPAAAAGAATVAPGLGAILAQLDPCPAFIIDSHWDFVAWNEAAGRLYGFDALPAAERNVLLFLFTDPAQRRRLVDWHKEARSAVARFRATTVYALGEPWHINLTSRLLAESPEFAALWQSYDIQETHANPKLVVDASGGTVAYNQTTLLVPDARGLQLVAQTPVAA